LLLALEEPYRVNELKVAIDFIDLGSLKLPSKDLASHEFYLTGAIIDVLIKYREERFGNFTYIENIYGAEIFGKTGISEEDQHRKEFKPLWFDFGKEYVIIPICHNFHWMLLIASTVNFEVTIIDPFSPQTKPQGQKFFFETFWASFEKFNKLTELEPDLGN
jgi:hypothetical protein